MGDAVLGLVTAEELFRRFPEFSEGQLSKLRAHLVSKNHLINVAERLELGRYLRLGRGEEKSGGRSKSALLVDALEAVLGAIYLDAGFETARSLILQHVLLPELEAFISSGRASKWGCNRPKSACESTVSNRLRGRDGDFAGMALFP